MVVNYFVRIFLKFILFLFMFCGAEAWIWGLVYEKQAFYHWPASPTLFLKIIFIYFIIIFV
jgi:hypothetical protein